MLRLIKQSLKVGVVHQGKVEPRRMGVPQGSPISPLYSNIYLNLLDRVWHSRNYPEKLGATLHRYADDVILVCRRSAVQALAAFKAIACSETPTGKGNWTLQMLADKMVELNYVEQVSTETI